MSSLWLRWLAVLCLFACFGCGKRTGKVNITGKIIKGGAPFAVPDEEYVRVTFFPVTGDGGPPKNTYAASYNGKDGTFRAIGGDGQGIPPGKYRVAIEHEKKGGDAFRGVYDGDRSPFQFDVDRSSQPLVINLDQK